MKKGDVGMSKKKRSPEARVAFVLAVTLIVLTAITAVRQSPLFHDTDKTASTNTTARNDESDKKTITNTSDTPSTIDATLVKPHAPEVPSTDGIYDTTSSSSSDTSKKNDEAKSQSRADTTPYTYTAVAGSSYTEFARQAVASYIDEAKLNVDADARLNAEATLTDQAGSPFLEIGESVTISRDAVRAALPNAQVDTAKTADTKGEESAKKETAQTPAVDTNDVTATVVAGDSYTVLARKAIAQKLTQSNTTLNAAQKAAAESFLTDNAQSPAVNVGDVVTIKAADITAAMKQAGALSPDQQSMWQSYADSIIF